LKKDIDIVCIGEVLIDFIGNQLNSAIDETSSYQRLLGGSPSNVAMNIVQLGLKTVLVATVGDDGFGNYIIDELNAARIDTRYIKKLKNKPTSNIIISRSSETPEFIAYREADYQIRASQIPNNLLKRSKMFHTSCFALSKNPARKTILSKAQKAVGYNCKLSIDINYSNQIWPNRVKAIEIIKDYCQFNPLVKISTDDVSRLFGKTFTYQQVFDFFHKQNVEIVCLTLGSKGVMLSQKNKKIHSLPAVKVDEVVDVTGAGDAFWSGFLYAYIQQYPLEKCLDSALKLAALKLKNLGSIQDYMDIL